MHDVVGCNHCGYVARRDSFEGERLACPQCGIGLIDMAMEAARRLVSARRKADQRRSDAKKIAELGLDADAVA